MKQIPQFLIAAPASGSGKTTISIALMELLKRRGLKVQPFKCGPDYIDTKFHEKACGTPSYNLDSFFATNSHIKHIYERYAQNADICIVEGMMGLFDGYSRSRGSAGEIASILHLPVILVVDAKSSAYSLAPLLKGFRDFSRDVKITGVIFNKVGSTKHRMMLEEVCKDIDLEALGFIPKVKEAENPSRYLGLDFSRMEPIGTALQLIESNVDLDKLLSAVTGPASININREECRFSIGCKTEPESYSEDLADANKLNKILVARNSESFSFVYQEHLDKWPNALYFNPEEDIEIPQDIDILYLPGGYPEKHLEVLSRCGKTMESIRRYAENGGRILAECGGMMYLCKSIISDEGEFPMCGVLPYSITAKSDERKLSLGYRSFTLNGIEFKGHEFHYTKFAGEQPESLVQVFEAKGNKTDTPIVRIKNTIASYTHLYWGDKDIFSIFDK